MEFPRNVHLIAPGATTRDSSFSLGARTLGIIISLPGFKWTPISVPAKQRPLSSARFCGTNQASWTRDPRQRSRSPLWISTCSPLSPPHPRERDIREAAFPEIPQKRPVLSRWRGRGRKRFNSSPLVSFLRNLNSFLFFFFLQSFEFREAKSLLDVYFQTRETFLKLSSLSCSNTCAKIRVHLCISFELLRIFKMV